jgi:hypothetical protein
MSSTTQHTNNQHITINSFPESDEEDSPKSSQGSVDKKSHLSTGDISDMPSVNHTAAEVGEEDPDKKELISN